MALRTITPATTGLITLDQAKAQCRVQSNVDDALLTGLILAAGNLVEAMTQRRYLAQTLEWVLDGWHEYLSLPIAPVGDSQAISVPLITYADLNGASQTLDPAIYWVRPRGASKVILKRWYVIWPWLGDAAERIVVRIVVTGDLTTVPANVAAAVKLLVSHWYEHRDAVVGVENRDSSGPLPLGVEALLSSERWS